MSDKLTIKEKREIVVQAGLELVPYVGGSLSTLYFSTKQEKRFKRLESFYRELADKMSNIELNLPSISLHDEDSLAALIDHLNEKIEVEYSNQKRELFKNYFINILNSPTVETNFDIRYILLDILANLTITEFQTLLSFTPDYIDLRNELRDGFNYDLDESAKSRLEANGLLKARYQAQGIMGSLPVNKTYYITELGIEFINFCQ